MNPENKMTQSRVFRPLPVPAVTVGGLFGSRQEAICDVTAETLLNQCVKAGMLRQIDLNEPSPGVVIVPHSMSPTIPLTEQRAAVSTQMFWDSDLGKSIETIAYSLYRKPNPALEARADFIIDCYERLQRADGYLNSWFQRIDPGNEWTNLRDKHELYSAGHMIEGAVAYFQATGKRKFMDIMARFADHMIALFGHGPGQLPGYCGHEEIELALVKLARATGERRYMDLAKFFIDERGTQPHFFDDEARRDDRDPANYIFGTYEYSQSHVPVRDQTKVVGHAVRAMYLYSGMADIAAEYADDSLTSALEGLWADLTTRQMHLTGGIGPSAANEGFTDHYDLPNAHSYNETCASVGLVFWAGRMLGRGPDRRYADVLEQALMNGAMSGLSQDGARFFYENPLESDGGHHRWTWHRCPCCPPNIARLLVSVGSYMYGLAEDEIAVHLYGDSEARFEIAGTPVTLLQATRYPWEGTVEVTVNPAQACRFVVSLRIPAWAEGATLALNGAPLDPVMERGYARVLRDWQPGDRLTLTLPLAPRFVWANPLVRQDAGRVAVMRGPLVYCAEGVDCGGHLSALTLYPGQRPVAEVALPALAGAVAVDLPATRDRADWGADLFRTSRPRQDNVVARLVPYFLWDNRDPGEMMVWLRDGGQSDA